MSDQANDPEQFQKKKRLFDEKHKYKNIQSDKKSYIDESVKAIKIQKSTIEKLKKENEALKDLISKMNKEPTSTNQKQYITDQQKQQILQQIRQSIKSQKQAQQSIDIHITNFQKKITEKRKNCMGMNSGAQNQNNLQKQIKILQNRLDKANQKFNQTTAHNKELKILIDSFRRERVIFDNLYKKLEKQLHEKRKKMADIIQKANNAYQERDKAHNQIQTLKIQAKKQASQFEKQIKDITYLMQKIKLSSYSKKPTKSNHNITTNLNLGQQSQTGTNFYYEQTSPQNPNLSLTTNQLKLTKQSKKNSQQVEKIQKFREDFAKIQAATQIQNFDQLLRIFSENQEKNFQMFKFVNLQSNQIQELQGELFQLKKQLKSVSSNYNFDADTDTQKNQPSSLQKKDNYIQELQKNLQSLKNELDQIKKQYQKNQTQIKPLTIHVQRIFQTIQCDRQLIKQLAGNKSISQNNLYIFLAIIQHKAIQIVNTFRQLSNPGIFAQPSKPANVQAGMLTFDDFQDNQEYNKLLTAEELRQKAKDFIQREQNQKQKKKEVRGKKK